MDNLVFRLLLKLVTLKIAELLLERGADVNFIETSQINEWRAPVLHDCIRTTIFNSYALQKDTSNFDDASSLLMRLLEKGANANAIDSYGNTCLHRAILDAKQMIDNPKADLGNGILIGQLRIVFSSLIRAGADPKLSGDGKESAEYLLKNNGLEEYELW